MRTKEEILQDQERQVEELQKWHYDAIEDLAHEYARRKEDIDLNTMRDLRDLKEYQNNNAPWHLAIGWVPLETTRLIDSNLFADLKIGRYPGSTPLTRIQEYHTRYVCTLLEADPS